jgi:hypothetical protein
MPARNSGKLLNWKRDPTLSYQLLRRNKACRRWVVCVAGDRSIRDPLHGFVDHGEGHQEPFARLHGQTEAIVDRKV